MVVPLCEPPALTKLFLDMCMYGEIQRLPAIQELSVQELKAVSFEETESCVAHDSSDRTVLELQADFVNNCEFHSGLKIMVRNYIRKTKRQTWDANVMQTALNEIANGMPFKRASKIFNLPLTTLKRRAKGQNKLAKGNSKHLGRCISTLPEEIETSLKNYALEMEDRLFWPY
ncbi:hypothetical protein ILUMI_23865 [Ignelater luminosus]|uniref:HTH psq-type domain-containing protein n=1 Tax=Ignelater luminosus TaxID=2038154 RepID=A0A8K0FWR9_IGNLU|nr:hypothetical protein ILUMI_23865 [Ignelater luminosus]